MSDFEKVMLFFVLAFFFVLWLLLRSDHDDVLDRADRWVVVEFFAGVLSLIFGGDDE